METPKKIKALLLTGLKELLKDKDGRFSLREVGTAVFILVLVCSWFAQQFFGFAIPEYMFYGFVSLIGAGLFGYSLERKGKT